MKLKRTPGSLFTAAIVVVWMSIGGVGATAIDAAAPPPVLKLAVLLDYSNASLAVDAETLVEKLTSRVGDSLTLALTQRFQRPTKASLLITKRLPQIARISVDSSDPDELLHRYVVLEFPDTATTLAAKAVLQKDPGVLFVKESTFGQFSVSPADPLYPVAPAVQNYQWGINNPLNLQALGTRFAVLRISRTWTTASRRTRCMKILVNRFVCLTSMSRVAPTSMNIQD